MNGSHLRVARRHLRSRLKVSRHSVVIYQPHVNFYFPIHNWLWQPGPASTVGERPPTNPAIRVRFPVLLSRRVTIYRLRIYARPRFIGNKQHAIYWRRKSSLQLSLCMKGNVALKIGPMTSSDRCDVIYSNYALLQMTLATCHNNGHKSYQRRDKMLIGSKPRHRKKVPQPPTRQVVGRGQEGG